MYICVKLPPENLNPDPYPPPPNPLELCTCGVTITSKILKENNLLKISYIFNRILFFPKNVFFDIFIMILPNIGKCKK